MIGDYLAVLINAIVLAIPVSTSLLFARWVGGHKQSQAEKGFIFWMLFSRILLTLAIIFTVVEVINAAQHPSGTQWGKSSVSLLLNYFIILIPFSAFLGFVLAKSFRAATKRRRAQEISDGNAEKPPGVEREP